MVSAFEPTLHGRIIDQHILVLCSYIEL